MKTCKKCNNTKPIDQFYKNHRLKDGLTTTCKKCLNEKTRQYRIKNRDKLKEYHRLWMRKKRGGVDWLEKAIAKNEKEIERLHDLLNEQKAKLSILKTQRRRNI